jgi:hypothetical protein
MADIWIPGWDRVDLGPDGGPYDDRSTPKGCIHTTEGTSLAGAEGAYAGYPPHLGYDPIRRIKHQYVALNRSSYAFRGSESDDEYIIQIEVVGFAAKTHTWPNWMYANIAEDVIKPLEQLVGIPRNYKRFYRADEGIVLARANSPIRLTAAALRAYSGWLGHQHIPAPDEHWDPGGFLMDLALSYMEDDVAAADVWKQTVTWTPPGATKPVTVSYGMLALYDNYYSGIAATTIQELVKIIAANETNDVTVEKFQAMFDKMKADVAESIAKATIDVDVTVGGKSVDTP